MGDKYHAGSPDMIFNIAHDRLFQVFIKPLKRLVKDHRIRIRHHSADDGYTPLHAAAELRYGLGEFFRIIRTDTYAS